MRLDTFEKYTIVRYDLADIHKWETSLVEDIRGQ